MSTKTAFSSTADRRSSTCRTGSPGGGEAGRVEEGSSKGLGECPPPPLALTAQDSVPQSATHSGGHCARRGCDGFLCPLEGMFSRGAPKLQKQAFSAHKCRH